MFGSPATYGRFTLATSVLPFGLTTAVTHAREQDQDQRQYARRGFTWWGSAHFTFDAYFAIVV